MGIPKVIQIFEFMKCELSRIMAYQSYKLQFSRPKSKVFLLLSIFRCSFISSSVFLTLISVQRVVLIKSLNQTTHLFTWKKTFAYFCLIWTILVLLQLLPLLEVWGHIGHKEGLPYCYLNSGLNKLIHMVGYFLPLITLIICYVIIHKRIKDAGLKEREVQVTKTALKVVGTFVLLYTAGFIVYIFNPMPGPNAVPQLHVAVYLLGWSHAFVNPIIYIYYNGFFRKQFCRVLKIKIEDDDNTSSMSPQPRPSGSGNSGTKSCLLSQTP